MCYRLWMKVMVNLDSCRDCHHFDSPSLSFCKHPRATRHGFEQTEARRWSRRQRIVLIVNIPSWCPLRHGEQY